MTSSLPWPKAEIGTLNVKRLRADPKTYAPSLRLTKLVYSKHCIVEDGDLKSI